MATLHIEPELIARSQRGDAQAFDEVVGAAFESVYNTAYRMVGDPDDASDATQEAFVRAFKSLKSFRRDASFSTWLYRITTNVCLDLIRRSRRHASSVKSIESADDDAPAPELPDDTWMPHEVTETHERQEIVHKAIGTLTEEQRSVLVLFDIQGLAYEEISESLQIPVGTVKSRLNRARLALTKALGPQMELLR